VRYNVSGVGITIGAPELVTLLMQKIQHHNILTATTRIVINFLSAATTVKQNRINAAPMNVGIQIIRENNTTVSQIVFNRQ